MKQPEEELLHFIWNTGLLFSSPLLLTTGEPLTVLQPGLWNHNAGPDFLQGSARIDNTTWYGNIEMHVRSSDWYAHQHHLDKAYRNVILHVVYIHDKEITQPDGHVIPTLELYQLLPPVILKRYQFLKESKSKIPCEPLFQVPKPLIAEAWLSRLFIDRIERKTADFQLMRKKYQGDWEKAFLVLLARYFGQSINAVPFEWLAHNMPYKLIQKFHGHERQIILLLRGMAGLHSNAKDKRAFKLMQHKYQLPQIDKSNWKYSRMHPGNFPDRRIDELAMLFNTFPRLLAALVNCNHVAELQKVLKLTKLNQTRSIHLLVNCFLPALLAWEQERLEQPWRHQLMELVDQLPAESNAIIRMWQKLGMPCKSVKDSQALIELKTVYCNRLNCLQCSFGRQFILYESDI